MKTINRIKNIKPIFSTRINFFLKKHENQGENILKQPVKIETIKLQRKTY
jgi:hypothetical protein